LNISGLLSFRFKVDSSISVQRSVSEGTTVLSVEQWQRALHRSSEIIAAEEAGGGHRRKETLFGA